MTNLCFSAIVCTLDQPNSKMKGDRIMREKDRELRRRRKRREERLRERRQAAMTAAAAEKKGK